jgi:hypothetical protein
LPCAAASGWPASEITGSITTEGALTGPDGSTHAITDAFELLDTVTQLVPGRGRVDWTSW